MLSTKVLGATIGCDKILTHSPKPLPFKNWGYFFVNSKTIFFVLKYLSHFYEV